MIVQEPLGSVNAGPRNIAARRLIALALCITTTVVLPGCYAFVPTTNLSLAATTPVTVRLTSDGSKALGGTLGQGVAEVEGTVIRSTPDSLQVAVERMYAAGRQAFSSSGTTVTMPRSAIDQVQVRTFSKKRTIWTVLGAIALGAGAGATVGAGGGNAQPPGGGTTPP